MPHPTTGLLVLDGGLATELAGRGHDLSDALWSARLLQQSVALAQAARAHVAASASVPKRDMWVAASVGPYGAKLHDGSEYRGDYGVTEDELMAFHRPRIAALLGAGPDLLACETVPSLLEARAIVRVLPYHAS